jgi:AraC family transcriptional regulator
VVPRLGVDAKAIAKRHRYLTVIADPVQSRVLYLADERKPESLDGFRPMLTEAQPAGIQAVAMGMGEPYVQSARAALPEAGATIVFDKFHVVKHPDDAVHEVQRAEHRVLKQGASCMRSPESEVRRPIRRYDAPLLWQASTDWHGFRVVSSRYDAAGHREFDWQIPELMLAIRLSGQTHHEARFDGGRTERFVVCAGQVRLLPADQRVRGHTQGDGTTRNALLLLEPDWIARASGGEFDLSRLDLRWSSDLRNPLILEALLGLVREVEQPGLMGRIYAESLALAILTELVRYHPGAPSQAEGIASRRLPRITEYIEAHLGADLSLVDLAAEAGISRAHFVREFRRLTGLSPHQYVLRRRVERAAALLKTRDPCLKALALDVGFSSQSHLTAAFRRVYGITPGAYRDRYAAAG